MEPTDLFRKHDVSLRRRERYTSEAAAMTLRGEIAARIPEDRAELSPAQFYRLLDQTNNAKSVGQLLALLSILDCEVALLVRHDHEEKPSVVRAV